MDWYLVHLICIVDTILTREPPDAFCARDLGLLFPRLRGLFSGVAGTVEAIYVDS